MDSHITGPRGRNGYGAILSGNTIRAAFGMAALAGIEVLRTFGASAATPILVDITGKIPTAFNGSGAVFTLVETNLDGTGSTNIAAISDFSSGSFALRKFLTVDKIYRVTYTPRAGANATFANGVTNSDTSLVSSTAAFVAADVGKTVTGAGIPVGTTISSRTNGTTVVLSNATTATATGVSFTIVDRGAAASAGEGFYNITVSGVGQLPTP